MFKKAVAVWIDGECETMNSQLVLRAELCALGGCQLWITASAFYRLSINGNFVAFGPARAAGGYARVDCIDLEEYDSGNGKNELLIEVAGYHCRSLAAVLEKNFVTAEVRKEGQVLMATGENFEGYRSCRRIQKVERYSLQRHFGEIWDEREAEPYGEKYRAKLTAADLKVTYIPRGVPMADCRERLLDQCYAKGTFVFDEDLPYRAHRYSTTYDQLWDKFEESEIEYFPFRWLQRQQLQRTDTDVKLPLELKEQEYAVFDFRLLEAGFLQWELEATMETELVIGFSEMCVEKDFEFTKMNAHNVVQVMLPAGTMKRGGSFEPYTFRFCVLMVKKGSVKVNAFGVRRFIRDMSEVKHYEIRDPELREIYDAAVRTFSHNAVDIFTDCPSRERGGWLCDSFFTARAEYFLFGKTPIEDVFLENYRLYQNHGEYPKGVLPMVYPSDHQELKNDFIPQWDMWYVLEAAEYLTERNPQVDRELFRESILGVLDFLAEYENADGLLEKLPSWNFIEWSTANEWGWDINYPTNFLYAQALEMAGKLYQLSELEDKAEKIRKIVLERSFDGAYFVDHAVLDEQGCWKNLTDTSEASQYYAILFSGLDLEDPRYQTLKANVLTGFRERVKDGRVFVPVNAFIGMYLRICVLMKLGERKILGQDLKEFFGEMVASTGTLWEYKQHRGSYDHGFASLAAMAAVFAEE